MAAPALHKTWQGGSTAGGTQFVNVVVTGVTPKDTLWAIKNSMVNFFANPWTVIGSSDGVTSSMDGTDRWVDSGDIVYPTISNDPFSWIVLQQTALGATFQVLLHASETLAADPQREHIGIAANAGGYGAANGGTDGAINSTPGVADGTRNFAVDGTDWLGAQNGGDTQKVLTCISSTDGACFRAIVSEQATGTPITGLGIEAPRLPPATLTNPVVVYLYKSTVASGLSCFRWETMADSVTNGEMFANVDNVIGAAGYSTINMMPMMPMFSTVEVVDLQEDDRPNPMLYPPMLIGADVGAAAKVTERYYGSLFDWYWCNRNVAGKHLLDLDTIPLAGNRTFVCVGDCVYGWLNDSATDLSYT